MPFLTAGDPDLDFTAQLILAVDSLQPGLIELGFPYSDPIADGPVIQESYTRALNRHLKVDQIFQMMAGIQTQLTQPVVAMVSYAIVLRYGTERFLETARNSGFSGLIVPDFLWNPDDPLRIQCVAAGLDLIPLVTPTTPSERAASIAHQASGFIYYVSVAGVTGERRALPVDLAQNLAALRRESTVPVCVGFGISQPEQVTELRPHCDGVIVGSAIIKRIAQLASAEGESDTPESRAAVIAGIQDFVRELMAAGR